MAAKLMVLALGVAMLASVAASDSYDKFEKLNAWLVANVPEDSAAEENVVKAYEYFKDNKKSMSYQEQSNWSQFCDLFDVFETQCSSKSYNTLFKITFDANVVNPDDLNPESRVHKVINRIAKTHSQLCETQSGSEIAEKRKASDKDMVRITEDFAAFVFERLMPANNLLHPYSMSKLSVYAGELRSAPLLYVAGRVLKLMRLNSKRPLTEDLSKSEISRFVLQVRGHCQKYVDTFKDSLLLTTYRTFHSWTKPDILNTVRAVETCKDYLQRNQDEITNSISYFI